MSFVEIFIGFATVLGAAFPSALLIVVGVVFLSETVDSGFLFAIVTATWTLLCLSASMWLAIRVGILT